MHGALNLHVLGVEEGELGGDVLLLDLDELVQGEGAVGGEVDEEGPGDDAEVGLHTVLDDVIHVVDELIQTGEP